MMSMACGLATTGKVPYASTFAIFATGRAYDQVRLGHRPQRAAGAGLRVARRAVAGRGRRLAPDDRGHRPDARDAEDAGGRAGRLQPGLPRRARELRPRGPDVHALRPAGDAVRLRRGARDARARASTCCATGSDISIFACGHMVWRALEAAESSHRDEGVDAEVVNVAIIKPLDSEAVLSSLARTRRRRDRRGAPQGRRPRGRDPRRWPPSSTRCRSSPSASGTRFGLSGTGEAVMERFGLTAEGIADTARQALVLKPILGGAHSPVSTATTDT